MHCTDILVIGGGIAGVGCATMLSDSAQVTLLEREADCGYHTTGRSAAMHVPSYGPDAIRRLTVASEAYLQAPPDALETDSILSLRGDMMLARPGEEAELESLLRESAGHVEIPVAEAVERVPILRADRISRAAIEEHASDIDVDRLLQSWVRLFKRQQGRLETHAGVTSINRQDGVWVVVAGERKFSAPIVVNAAGAWGDAVGELAGLKPLGLTPCRRSAALIPAPEHHDFLNWPMIASVREDWYARPMAGKLMVSPADEDPVEAHDAFADDMRLAEGFDQFEKMVSLPVTRVEHTWGGLRTFSPDREPVMGYASDESSFFWLVGQGGYGIQTSPALSQLAADQILERSISAESAAIAALVSPARFGG